MEDKSYKIVLGCLAVILSFVQPMSFLHLIAIAVVALCVWYRRKILVLLRTLPRDIGFLKVLLRVKMDSEKFKKKNFTPASMLSVLARNRPNDAVLLYDEHVWTYKQLDEFSWQIAQYFHKMGFKQGDVVALLSTNRPEYAAFWIGLSRLGVVTALVNTSLRNMALEHSLNVVNTKAVVVSADLCEGICEIKKLIPGDCKLFKFCGADQSFDGACDDFIFLNPLLEREPLTPIEGLSPPSYDSELLYIYTSGTTGLPKAAIMKTSRYLGVVLAAVHLGQLTAKDRMYTPLPLYHSAGSIVGVGPAITHGLSCVLRGKFSASKYWENCAKYKCTVAQYIGEMCRYLLASPATQFDKKHQVEKMFGNGLKSNIWQNFLDRFAVPKVVEFYGSTEGNCSIVNYEGKVGAVGFLPNILPTFASPLALVKVNEQTGELIRSGKDNLCIRCEPGEPGMIIGKIKDSEASRQYHGYVDKSDSAKKVAHDVFEKGDKYFMSGDILVCDELGYLYFKDRTGDTFRWKGENVSTAEVENAITSAAGLRDACVYGVEILGTDGRAGMATIVDSDSTLDLDALAKSLARLIPSYAQPIFLRIAKNIDMTSTFKLKKIELQRDAFDPAKVNGDALYIRKGKLAHYEKLTPQLYQDILLGNIKF
ncbi:long-chain fatty acid transport protein 1-like [Neocloeon triangulifer]|uniref:long-chain fatty acid transport protein 1-like n=1 Tax=Neocloeon triangulifer TaxID=2078957 RepID=UPI00286F445D|nr:long-chain fatty acid transport protein 1-like [Neocloeon triangulifer]